MLQQIILLAAAIVSWIIDFITAKDEKPHYRVLRSILLLIVMIAGGFAIYEANKQKTENAALNKQIADLARKPDIVLVANGYEVTTNKPIPCVLNNGVYTLEFDFFNRSTKSASDATLSIILPDDLQVINANEWRKLSGISTPNSDHPAPTLNLRNYYQGQLGRALFPQSMEAVGRIVFTESGDKVYTRSVFAEINSIESGRKGMSFDIELRQ